MLGRRWQPLQKMLSVAGSIALITSVLLGGARQPRPVESSHNVHTDSERMRGARTAERDVLTRDGAYGTSAAVA
jgi:hypothetical protein